MELDSWLCKSHLNRFQHIMKNACHFSGLYVTIKYLCFFLIMDSLGNVLLLSMCCCKNIFVNSKLDFATINSLKSFFFFS